MSATNWRIGGTQSTSAFVGENVVVGGGRFQFTLVDPSNRRYTAIYAGAGAGRGVSPTIVSGRAATLLLGYAMPSFYGMLNSFASVDIAGSRLYSFAGNSLELSELNRTLYIINMNGEAGVSFNGSILIWEAAYRINNPLCELISVFEACSPYLNGVTINTYSAVGLAAGISQGMVGANATITMCRCLSFEPAR